MKKQTGVISSSEIESFSSEIIRLVRPAKIQISLRIRAIWSESPLGILLNSQGCSCFHAINENSDQTAPDLQAMSEGTFSDVAAYIRKKKKYRQGPNTNKTKSKRHFNRTHCRQESCMKRKRLGFRRPHRQIPNSILRHIFDEFISHSERIRSFTWLYLAYTK